MRCWKINLQIVLCLAFSCVFYMGACGGGNGGGARVPAAPTNLQVDSTTSDSATLSWTDNATDETGYKVQRGPSSLGPFTTVATLGQDGETYTQSTLSSGRYYFYRVCAYNGDGDSPYSEVVLATTDIGPGGGYPIPAVADSLSELEWYANDSNGYTTTNITYIGPGTDSAWGTSDDEINTYCFPTRNPDHTVDVLECFGAGNDGDWFTSDDPIVTYSTYAYNSTGNLFERDRYSDAGTDMVWGNGDDLLYCYEIYSYDSSDRRTGLMRVDDAGIDGDWFTPDDVVDRIYKYSYDADGYRNMRIQSRDPGTDGDWFTPDDVIHNYYIYDRDSNGKTARRYTYSDGDDGDWFTGDDELTGHAIHVRDINGYLLGEFYYGGPGSDGVWFE